MSVSVQIKADTKEVKRMLKNLKGGANKVLVRSLNRTLTSVNSTAAKSISKDLRVTQKVVKKGLKVYKANYRFKRASVNASGYRIPIIDLGAKKLKKGTITYKGRFGGRVKAPTGSFLATMSSGHRGVFKRSGKTRLPIDELHGASIPYVLVRRHIALAMDKTAETAWQKNLSHEMKRFIKNA